MSINCSDNLIDLSVCPSVPSETFSIARHVSWNEYLEWDVKKVSLYLDEGQQGDGLVRGYELWRRMGDKPVLGVSVLDYLLKYPEQIPEDWKGDDEDKTLFISFWDTLYQANSPSSLFVRCLFWSYRSEEWRDLPRFLGDNWSVRHPSAISYSLHFGHLSLKRKRKWSKNGAIKLVTKFYH